MFLLGDLAITLGTTLVLEIRATSNRPLLKEGALWRDEDSSETLQKRLDAHISALKKERRRPEDFSISLPLPMRFTRDDIQELSLKFMGKLTFEAHFDKHDFFVNPKRKQTLREALRDAGFLH